MLTPGDPAPDFILRNQRAEHVRLADFLGKPVLIWFYPKASTPG